ncbi:MAG: hypothetical protein B6245_06985, partial [Desulfobacteraceae bacterium 4572_88]
DHQTDEVHPENARRLKAIYEMLDGDDMLGHFTEISPKLAEDEQTLLIHSPEYLKKITATKDRDHCALTPDTHTCAASYDTALLAVGGLFQAISAEKLITR